MPILAIIVVYANKAASLFMGPRKRKAAVDSAKSNVKRLRSDYEVSRPNRILFPDDFRPSLAEDGSSKDRTAPIIDAALQPNGNRERKVSQETDESTVKRVRNDEGSSPSNAIWIDDEEIPGETTEDSAESNRKRPTSFLSLPYELRRMIYDEYFETNEVFDVSTTRTYLDHTQKSLHLDPTQKSLLLSCRAINDDLTTILYGENRFVLHTAQNAEIFLTQLRRTSIAKMRDFEISLDKYVRKDVVRALIPYMNRVHRLEVRVDYDPDPGPDPDPWMAC